MDIKAKYATRPDKFLTSVLMNGPNNQLIGLRETMFIAIKLNRSYILVCFFHISRAKNWGSAYKSYLRDLSFFESVLSSALLAHLKNEAAHHSFFQNHKTKLTPERTDIIKHWNAYGSTSWAAAFELSSALSGHRITTGYDQQTFIFILKWKSTRPNNWFMGKNQI